MGFLLGFFDKTQKPNLAQKKIGFFPSLMYTGLRAFLPLKSLIIKYLILKRSKVTSTLFAIKSQIALVLV